MIEATLVFIGFAVVGYTIGTLERHFFPKKFA